ncbi:uncharacterized protein LOC118499814 [Phyllostomus discolor]|uniref:Uncharacterized protein LOC118499814 n=1 Tax=Phyllostomus discolor TaxID=89673 RepID=A0A7E6DGI3_9CHIR|nr:uncharacterized protein LOC118499814 [Phyllostomus discolor]
MGPCTCPQRPSTCRTSTFRGPALARAAPETGLPLGTPAASSEMEAVCSSRKPGRLTTLPSLGLSVAPREGREYRRVVPAHRQKQEIKLGSANQGATAQPPAQSSVPRGLGWTHTGSHPLPRTVDGENSDGRDCDCDCDNSSSELNSSQAGTVLSHSQDPVKPHTCHRVSIFVTIPISKKRKLRPGRVARKSLDSRPGQSASAPQALRRASDLRQDSPAARRFGPDSRP